MDEKVNEGINRDSKASDELDEINKIITNIIGLI